MTYNWYDTRASTWYEGYGPMGEEGGDTTYNNTGSFVDLTTLTAGTDDYNTALDAITNNILGLFEDKGITAEQAKESDNFKALLDKAKAGDTKGAFQGAASAVTSAETRGDLWGASVEEGGDALKGKSFLEAVKAGDIKDATVSDLFTTGFLRDDAAMAADTSGKQYWDHRLAGTGGYGEAMSIAEIAASFLASDEAQVRDIYHKEYAREADTAGLNYFLTSNDESITGISDAQNMLNIISYRGEDLNNDGVITKEEQAKSKYNVSAETSVRDDMQNILGLVSKEAHKANNPFFTAANNEDVAKYVDYIRDARSSTGTFQEGELASNIDATTGERIKGQGVYDDSSDEMLFTNTHLAYRGLTKDALNQGDVDDWDEDGADPTYMGRFATNAEIKAYMDAHMEGDSGDLKAAQDSGKFIRGDDELKASDDMNEYGKNVFASVMDKKWGALTHEKEKTLDDYVPWDKVKSPITVGTDPITGDPIITGGSTNVTKTEIEKLINKDNLDIWKKNSSLWSPTAEIPEDKGPTGEDGWRIDPSKPDLPSSILVNRRNIDYMPNVSSDVQDTSGYGQAKTQFDQAVAGTPIARTAQGTTGQRFTGTSAKGVRMKRSKASRMGTIRGTKQLGREQQTKSLNI
tara:strand:- start:1 stop:1902 length:1902 start_codon:yes stop_codon:yes gene_type:complete